MCPPTAKSFFFIWITYNSLERFMNFKTMCFDTFWSTPAFALPISRPETALECPEAAIPQFTTLVFSLAPNCFTASWHFCGVFVASWTWQQIHMYGCTFAGITQNSPILECSFYTFGKCCMPCKYSGLISCEGTRCLICGRTVSCMVKNLPRLIFLYIKKI